MDWLLRYEDDLEEIVELAWSIYNHSEVRPTKSHLRALAKELSDVFTLNWNSFVILKEDIRQELVAQWTHYRKKFLSKVKKCTSLRDYLLQCSIFGLRNWFRKQLLAVSHAPKVEREEEYRPGFRLDMMFLRYGTGYYPLDKLLPYERYLLFLRFKEDKSISDIAYITQQTGETVSSHLRKILDELRRSTNDTQDAR